MNNNNNNNNNNLIKKLSKKDKLDKIKQYKNLNLKNKLYENENLFQEADENVKSVELKFVDQLNVNEEQDEQINEKNLNYLWSLSHYSQPVNPSLGGYYMYKFREIANIVELKGIPEQIESRNCKNCGTFLVPGVNCRVRIVKRSLLSNRSKSLISSSNLEINSLQSKLDQRSNKRQSKLKKPTNAITKLCLQCNKLNPLKGEPLSKRNSRKLLIKNESEKITATTTTTNTTPIPTTPPLNTNNTNNSNNKQKANNNNNNNNNNNKPNNNKIKIGQAGSKNITNKKDESLKDFLSGMGGLFK